VLGRLRQAPYAGGTGAIAALGSGGPTLAYGEPATDAALAYAAKKPSFPIKAPPLAAPAETPDLTFWAQGVGAWGKIDSDGNAADASRNLSGVFTGFDRRFSDWRAGLADAARSANTRLNSLPRDSDKELQPRLADERGRHNAMHRERRPDANPRAILGLTVAQAQAQAQVVA
jgi:hypothetical protein